VLPRILPIACLAALALAAPAAASSTQTVTFEAPRDLMDPAARPDALKELESLGVRALRVQLRWTDVAPDADLRVKPSFNETEPDSYHWGEYAEVLNAAKERGWRVLLTIATPAPRWATAGARDHVYRPSPNEFRKFVTAVGKKFGDRISLYSILNEPNHPDFLKPQLDSRGRPVSPGVYRGLYAAALRGLAGAGETAKPVLMGETAPVGTSKVVAPLTFLRGALCLNSRYHRDSRCERLRVDAWAHHAYTTRKGPFYVPDGPNNVTIGVLSRLTRALDRAARAGAVPKRLPVHLTEFGIQSEPDPVNGVSFQRQEEYRAISERIAWANPRVASFSQYLLRDDNPVSGVPRIARYSGFESGLRTASGNPKASFDGFRLPLVAKRGKRSVTLWGLVRPGDGGRAATVEYSGNGGKSWHKLSTVGTNGLGYWKKGTAYRKGRVYRVTWIAPDGQTYTGATVRAYR
jgi:hypothetical protein